MFIANFVTIIYQKKSLDTVWKGYIFAFISD